MGISVPVVARASVGYQGHFIVDLFGVFNDLLNVVDPAFVVGSLVFGPAVDGQRRDSGSNDHLHQGQGG